MKRIFAMQEATYVNEWFGMLQNKLTILLFKENPRMITIKSYKPLREDHVSKILIPFKMIGRGTTETRLPYHFIYTIASFLLLPLILLHSASVFVTPSFFYTMIIPILKLFRKRIYLIVVDPQDVLYRTYRERGSFLVGLYWKFSRAMELMAVRSATKIFAVSQYLVDECKKYNTNVFLTPNGADTDSISKIKPKRMFKEFTIAYFGSFDEWRGVDMLIEAFKKLRNRRFKLLLLGGGSQEQDLRKLAKGDKNIYISGYIDHDEAIAYCKGADILVIPFRETPILRKTSSIKTFEYIACGVPIVATDTGEHAEWISKLGCGKIAKPTAGSIATVLSKLAENKEEYLQLSKNCKDAVEKVDYRNLRKDFVKEVAQALSSKNEVKQSAIYCSFSSSRPW